MPRRLETQPLSINDADITAAIDTAMAAHLASLTGIPPNYLNTLEPINYDNITYSSINTHSLNLVDNQDNTITFFNNSNNWVMKIQDNNILFNTEQFTIDEITKIFLQRLEQLTHREGLQYTFNF